MLWNMLLQKNFSNIFLSRENRSRISKRKKIRKIWKTFLQQRFLLFKTNFFQRRVSLMDMIQIPRLTIIQKYLTNLLKIWEKVKNSLKNSKLRPNHSWNRVITSKITSRIMSSNSNWQYLNLFHFNKDRNKDKQKKLYNHHQNSKLKTSLELHQHPLLF